MLAALAKGPQAAAHAALEGARAGRGAGGRAARAPGLQPRGAGRQRAPLGRHGEGPRHRGHGLRPGGAGGGVRGAAGRRGGHHVGRRRARRRSPTPGLPVDLRIVPDENFGNLLQHFTGSGRHNEALRTQAVKRGLHVSEYGVADDETGETARVLHRGGGLRAARHGVRAARAAREPRRAERRTLPDLIELGDIKGDLHSHTTPPTAATRSPRWPRPRRSAATSTWRSPTTPPRTGSATT